MRDVHVTLYTYRSIETLLGLFDECDSIIINVPGPDIFNDRNGIWRNAIH